MGARALLAATVLLAATAPACAADDPALAVLLKARTQAMSDAIPIADKAVWDTALDPAVMYVTENDIVMDKAAVMADLVPLPAGLVGKAIITDYRLQRYGDMAIATYIADEGLDYHGQHIQTHFRITDTWALRPAGWRIVGSQTLAVLDDPPAIALPQTKLADYAGRYTLTPDIHYVVRVADGKLLGLRDGGKEVALVAEAPDLFFVAGSPRSRKVFVRDAAGRVIGFGDRREGHDIMWKRES